MADPTIVEMATVRVAPPWLAMYVDAADPAVTSSARGRFGFARSATQANEPSRGIERSAP